MCEFSGIYKQLHQNLHQTAGIGLYAYLLSGVVNVKNDTTVKTVTHAVCRQFKQIFEILFSTVHNQRIGLYLGKTEHIIEHRRKQLGVQFHQFREMFQIWLISGFRTVDYQIGVLIYGMQRHGDLAADVLDKVALHAACVTRLVARLHKLILRLAEALALFAQSLVGLLKAFPKPARMTPENSHDYQQKRQHTDCYKRPDQRIARHKPGLLGMRLFYAINVIHHLQFLVFFPRALVYDLLQYLVIFPRCRQKCLFVTRLFGTFYGIFQQDLFFWSIVWHVAIFPEQFKCLGIIMLIHGIINLGAAGNGIGGACKLVLFHQSHSFRIIFFHLLGHQKRIVAQ